jgi:hypothetical protein
MSFAGVLVAASCAEPQRIPPPYQPGYAEYMLGADEHDQQATEQAQVANVADAARGAGGGLVCPDSVLNDQLTGGFGAPLTTFQPCFDVAEEAAEEHRAIAAEEAAAARHDRALAGQLVHAEVAACGGIATGERSHTVFAHRKAIADVIPDYSAGQLHGVWVVFRPIEGLSADWMRRDIACQRARWAVLGGKTENLPDDPTLIPDSQVHVFQRGDHVELLVTTATTADAELAFARAKDAAQHAQTATR